MKLVARNSGARRARQEVMVKRSVWRALSAKWIVGVVCVALATAGGPDAEARGRRPKKAHAGSAATRGDGNDARLRSPDFRIRVGAVLHLGRAKPAGARAKLERALGDSNPAVRTAAAAALGALGDPKAIGELRSRMRKEKSGSVRSQMQKAIATLQARPGKSTTNSAHYVLQIGKMECRSKAHGSRLDRVLRDAAKANANSIKGALVAESSRVAQVEHKKRRLPVLQLDGSLVRLDRHAQKGSVMYTARVEFTVRRVPEHTLRGTLVGDATSVGTRRSMRGGKYVAQLQEQAVHGAVESALRGADVGLRQALK